VYRPGLDLLYLEEVLRLGIDQEEAKHKWYSCHGVPMLVQLLELGVSQSSAIAFCEEFFERCEGLPAQPIPGAELLLQTARALGLQVCVTTGSGQKLAEQTLRQAELLHLTDLVLGSEPGCLKGPEHMKTIKEYIDPVSPRSLRRSWMVGDGNRDMQLALQHGVGQRVGLCIPGVGGSNPQELQAHGAQWVAEDLEEVTKALLKGFS